MGDEIADTLEALVKAHGVGVHIEAHHLCTQMRGVRELHPKTRTAVWRGEYANNADLRSEFFQLTRSRAD
jgi:GTP cyclohydrolase I